jgi:hypothetical protein
MRDSSCGQALQLWFSRCLQFHCFYCIYCLVPMSISDFIRMVLLRTDLPYDLYIVCMVKLPIYNECGHSGLWI